MSDDRPIRALFFAHETTWSGAPIQLFHLARWLQSAGLKVNVAVPKPGSAESGPISDEFERSGIEIHPVIDLSVPPDFASLSILCQRFDVVVANTLVMWSAVQAARVAGIPVVWYIHESLVAKHLIELVPEIRPTLDLADAVVMPTQRTAYLYGTWTERRIEVIPYGIPPLTGADEPAAGRNKPLTFLLLGTYEPRKGQDVFLGAIALLNEPTRARARFVMAGRVLDRAFYESLALESRSLPNVSLLDSLSHDEAAMAIAQSDVLVCSSRDETMPVAILEAMSLGKVIVTAKVGGITEWLQDGDNALLFPPDDSESLAHSMSLCINEESILASLGTRASQTFLEHFSLEALGFRFLALFERLIREKTL
ncbi:MAG: glycosyltransferase family 4 protein [Chthoniobacterales bacterium]